MNQRLKKGQKPAEITYVMSQILKFSCSETQFWTQMPLLLTELQEMQLICVFTKNTSIFLLLLNHQNDQLFKKKKNKTGINILFKVRESFSGKQW